MREYLSFRACRVWSLALVFVAVTSSAWEDYAWDAVLRGRHDQPIVDKLGKGFFMNLGPTGVRAKITKELPCYFTVMFVFEDSPAAGKIKEGDVIVGANGSIMNVPHVFIRRGHNELGPLKEMGRLIEDAQGKDGNLEFIVWPGGDKTKQKSVAVKINAVGRFSPTYPFNCKRSDALLLRLCDFLAGEYKHDGCFLYRCHTDATCTLALMASGNPAYASIIKEATFKIARQKPTGDAGGSWGLGYSGIVLGEYYLLTHDPSVIPAIQCYGTAMGEGLSWASGSYSHYMFPQIMERVHEDGRWGYGPMSCPGGLSMLALSLYKDAGLPYPKEAYQRIHQSYLNTVDKNGAIGYGFNPWECAILKLKQPDRPEAKSTNGIGHICPKGIKGMGEYTVVPPTGSGAKPGNDGKDKSWLVSEADKVRVYDMGDDLRMAVRDMTRPEPTQPWPLNDNGSMHHGRMGLGVLAHIVGNEDNKSFKFLADHMASGCANSAEYLYDGHASGMMHASWGSLGAAKASPEKFRKYMDGIKWWFIMAEAHNGGFVLMPNRDYGPSDMAYASRNLVTGTAALILSLKDRRLRITGASSTGGSKTAMTTGTGVSETASKTDPASKAAPATTGVTAAATGTAEAHAAPAPVKEKYTKTAPAKEERAKAAPPEVPVSPETLANWRERLIKKLDSNSKAGRKLKLNFEDGQDYLVRGANDQALLVIIQGNNLEIPWRMLTTKTCAALAKDSVDEDDVESLLIAAVFQLAVGWKEQSETLFAKATLKDAAAAKQVRATLENQ